MGCAHAVSGAIDAIEGVDSVSVSLTEGRAHIVLKPGNKVALKQIQQAIQDRGFTIEEAELRINGTVAKRNDQVVLEVTGLDLLFQLQDHPEAEKKVDGLVESALDSAVSIVGHLPKSKEGKGDKIQTLLLREYERVERGDSTGG